MILDEIKAKQKQATQLLDDLSVSQAIEQLYPKAYDSGAVRIAAIGSASPPHDGDYSGFTMRFRDSNGAVLGVTPFAELPKPLQAKLIASVGTGVKK